MLATHATAQPSTHTYDPRVRQAITLSPPETWPLLALYARCSPMHSQVDLEAMPSTASCARTWRTSWQAVRKVGEVDYINDAFSRATGSADRAARDGRVHAMRQSQGKFGLESSVIIDRRLPLRASSPSSTTTTARASTSCTSCGASENASADRYPLHALQGSRVGPGSRRRAAGRC